MLSANDCSEVTFLFVVFNCEPLTASVLVSERAPAARLVIETDFDAPAPPRLMRCFALSS